MKPIFDNLLYVLNAMTNYIFKQLIIFDKKFKNYEVCFTVSYFNLILTYFGYSGYDSQKLNSCLIKS